MNTYISASAWPSHLSLFKFNAQKGVTFHTNKARPHHLLCFKLGHKRCEGQAEALM